MYASGHFLRRASRFVSILLAAASLSLIGSGAAEAHDGLHHRSFGLHSLKGNYGFAAQGVFGANFDPATQTTTGAIAIRVGVFSFDGKGNCSIHSMANKAGLANAVAQDSLDSDSCTYTVDEFGTGMVDAVLHGTTFKTFFVIVNDGKEFMFTRREGTSNPPEQGGATLVFAVGKKQ